MLFLSEMSTAWTTSTKFKDKPAQEAALVAEAKELTPAEEKMQAVFKATENGRTKKSENVFRKLWMQAVTRQQSLMME